MTPNETVKTSHRRTILQAICDTLLLLIVPEPSSFRKSSLV